MSNLSSLQDLALVALRKYVVSLLSTKAENVKKNAKPKRKKMHIELEEFLASCVVPTIADEVTNRLLNDIEDSCSEVAYKPDNADDLVRSVIVPSVTRVKPARICLEASSYKRLQVPLHVIKDKLPSLPCLKVFHLPPDPLHGLWDRIIPGFPKNLEEFSGGCTDSFLGDLGTYCPNLKYLDISSGSVTDVSIDVFLQMNNLRKLNISETQITDEGIAQFLKKIKENKGCCQLKCLTFSRYTLYVIKLLKNLPNLEIGIKRGSQDRIFYDNRNWYSLNGFKNIRELSTSISLGNLNALLEQIGENLRFLDVKIINTMSADFGFEEHVNDVITIGRYCSSLKCLHVSWSVCDFPFLAPYHGELLPGFQSIACCSLYDVTCSCVGDQFSAASCENCYVFSEFIRDQCRNVKRWKMSKVPCKSDLLH